MAMKKLGYQKRNTDHTMFIQMKGDNIYILMVYVDDIILTCNNFVEMKMLMASLAKEFEMKDLSELYYFLGIKVA
jgi:Reverse transcriptase (RNA-dependent DNA polymerase)